MEALEYKERMLDYYPDVIKSINDYQAIINSEAYEFGDVSKAMEDVLNNAYLTTMDESRLSQWEEILNIRILPNSTIQDRRDVVIARLRGQGKLNTESINAIVNTFTGGSAKSWIEDSVLYVEITPPPSDKQYKFENVENELRYKVPAHLGLVVTRNYYTWKQLNESNENWGEVNTNFDTWEDVLLHVES
jgi:hypothetical protein